MTTSLPRINSQFVSKRFIPFEFNVFDRVILLQNLNFILKQPLLLRGHEKSITTVKFNADGDLLFSAAKDNRPTVWYADTGERLGTYSKKCIKYSRNKFFTIALSYRCP